MIVDPTVTYTYSQMMRDIIGLRAKYPKLINVRNAGYSVEGRQLPVIKLGTGKTKVFFCGSHHAREYITSPYLMYTINTYAKAAECGRAFGGYDMAKLLSKCTAHIMPMVNPDGIRLVQGGLKAVQDSKKAASMIMLRPTYSEWKANVNGVDLNRQYPALWYQKNVVVDKPASELFNGYEPASEPEVKTVMRYCEKYAFKSAISFHTKGEVIYYADANTNSSIPQAKAFAQSIAKVSGYSLMPVSQDAGVYAAGFENWFRQEFLLPGLLVELTPATGGTLPHNDKDFYSLVWDSAKYICAQAIKWTLQ